MPVNPSNGQLISTANLGINEVDALQLPRNAQLGPSRTAQERKQLRTMMYQQRLAVNGVIEDAIANDPVIEELVDAVEALQLIVDNSATTYKLEDQSGATASMPIMALDRIEDGSLDPYYYHVEWYVPFRLVREDVAAGEPDTFIINFNNDTQAHNLACSVIWADDETKDNVLIFDNTTDDVVTFEINSVDGTFFGVIHVTGSVAAVAEQVVMSATLNANGDTQNTVIMRASSFVSKRPTTNTLA